MWGPEPYWAVLRRPRLWGEALRALFAMAPRAWWSQGVRLPVPDPEYVRWRRATAYGSAQSRPAGRDVVDFLEWRRRFRRSLSRSEVRSG